MPLTLAIDASHAGQMDQQIQISQVISALSFALDLTEGQPMGHAARSCILGIRLARAVGLADSEQEDLYFALLLKDAGCSSNSSKMFHILGTNEIQAKGATKTLDWRRVGLAQLRYLLARVRPGSPWHQRAGAILDIALHSKQQTRQLIQMRCERGAHITRHIGLAENTAAAIYSLDEHWDGGGYPQGQSGQAIPVMARIMNLAQTLEVFHALHGPDAAIRVARRRSGCWFDPELVRAAVALDKCSQLWEGLDGGDAVAQAVAMEPARGNLQANDSTLDSICEGFAEVIDAKSHYTYDHSGGVTRAAVAIAATMGLDASRVTLIRRAALLHDIGKLSVPNTILEKPGKLTAEEWQYVGKHPYYTHAILSRISGFGELAEIAAAHHEKLDGSGYHRGLKAEQLPLEARILAVADIYDALAADRPYRAALPLDGVFGIMQRDTPHALDAGCVEALIHAVAHPEILPGAKSRSPEHLLTSRPTPVQ